MPPGSRDLLKDFAEDTLSSVLQTLELLKAAEEFLEGAKVNYENVCELHRDIHGCDPENRAAALKVFGDVQKNLDAVITALNAIKPPQSVTGLQPVAADVIVEFINKS